MAFLFSVINSWFSSNRGDNLATQRKIPGGTTLGRRRRILKTCCDKKTIPGLHCILHLTFPIVPNDTGYDLTSELRN